MAGYPYVHSYARYFLRESNIKITKNNKKIVFDYTTPQMPQNLPEFFYYKFKQPILKVGSFEKSQSLIEIKNYDDLKHKGFIINSYEIKKNERTFSGQHKIYKIKPIQYSGDNTLGGIPIDHIVMYDTINKGYYLKGPNSDNNWIYEFKQDYEKKELSFIDKLRISRGLSPMEKSNIINKEIEGIPIGISYEEWKLVCIPFSKNPIRAGFVGKTGKSKSIGMHMILDFLYNYGNSCCLLNDWKYETHTWNQPTDGADFINRLNKLGLTPKPLPTVYLTPNTRLKKILIGENENISEIISLSFKNIINHYNEFFSSFEEFKLGKTKRHFNESDIEKCKTKEEIYNVINEIDEKQFKQEKNKIRLTMDFLFDQEVCDINTKYPSSFNVKTPTTEIKELHPIIACMMADLFPIFLPKNLLTIKFGSSRWSSVLPSYMNNIVQSIYDFKNESKFLKGRDIYVAIDELNTITQKGVNQAIIDLANLGRTSGIGILWATQNYSNVLEDVKLNTDYLFCMQYDSQKEINEITNNYGAMDLVKENIKQLSKEIPHECYVFPSNPLLTYDLDNGKKGHTNEPIKIQLTPPISKHSFKGIME